MSPCRLISWVMLAGALMSTALAQNPPVLAPPVRGGVHPGPNHPRQEPCWEVAGISKSTMDQVRAMRQQGRREIEAVCANSSLSLAQKQQQIRSIREGVKQRVDTLIPPQQEESLRACQQQRAAGGGHGVGGRLASGPCGEIPKAKKPVAESDWEE